MKKLIFSLAALCFANLAQSQITLLDENFDSFPDFVITGFGNWQTLDLDGLPTYVGGTGSDGAGGSLPATWPNANALMAYQIFNPSVAGVTNNATANPSDNENRNFDPHSGLKYAAAWDSAVDPTVPTSVAQNNDWLISPAIQLGGSGNNLSFWIKSLSSSYGLERYKVGIYVGNGTPTSSADFTIISGNLALSAPNPAWGQKTYPLNAYNNQTVRIGIQCVSADVYMMMVDDVKITAATLGTSEVSKKDFSIFPIPSKGQFSIKSADKIAGIRVYDAAGKLVLENRNSTSFNISEQPTGVYYLNIAFGDGTIKTEKVIKE